MLGESSSRDYYRTVRDGRVKSYERSDAPKSVNVDKADIEMYVKIRQGETRSRCWQSLECRQINL